MPLFWPRRLRSQRPGSALARERPVLDFQAWDLAEVGAAPGGSEINHGIHRNTRKRESESTSPFRVLPGGNSRL